MVKVSENRRWAILEAHRNRCVYCNALILYKNLHIEHILPQSLIKENNFNQILKEHGLPANFDINGLSNLIPVCAGCNLQKNDHVLPPAAMNYQIENARRLEEKVLALEEKLERENKTGRSFSQLKSLSESGVLSPIELDDFVQNLKGLTEYRLFHKLTFADGRIFEKISKDDIPLLLSLPIKHGSSEDGLELSNENEEKRRIYNCQDSIAAQKDGFFPYTTYAIKMTAWFITVESIINALKVAKPPKTSFITAEDIGICSLHTIPASFLPWLEEAPGEYQKFAIESGKSFQDVINDGEASIRWIKPFSICIEYEGLGLMLREIMRADLNNDGTEDILLDVYTYATEGTFGASHSLTVSRDSEDSFFEPINNSTS